MIKIKIPKIPKNIISKTKFLDDNSIVTQNSNIFLRNFFKKKKIDLVSSASIPKKISNRKDINKDKKPFIPDLLDLYFLYNLVVSNNRINILEYGTGWSTIVLSKALQEVKLKKKGKFYNKVIKPFHLTVCDNSKAFLDISKKRYLKVFKNINNCTYNYSKVKLTKFNGQISTEYTNHPSINPDLIYLDGPNPYTINEKIDGFKINNNETNIPMNCDILKIENFLNPGTIIVADGRNSNIRFLMNNFRRKWKHIQVKNVDINILYLDEKPLGFWNQNQLDYFK